MIASFKLECPYCGQESDCQEVIDPEQPRRRALVECANCRQPFVLDLTVQARVEVVRLCGYLDQESPGPKLSEQVVEVTPNKKGQP